MRFSCPWIWGLNGSTVRILVTNVYETLLALVWYADSDLEDWFREDSACGCSWHDPLTDSRQLLL